ncbi:hypothetical protein EJ03DRAFT_95722 [Teratosphaeria nubilosa]|uniref:FHA domain-containing protein n=1 Tax=Teratosphaeria nubilosa TaxID=161662 RepID=A0A6G1L8X1_9PEZI|nr:hypothetical protein EJ03DRAFT_95722 [Teratosphaeria nubilosa]
MPPLLMNLNPDMLSSIFAVPQQTTSILGQNQAVHFTFEQKNAAAFPAKRHLTIQPGETIIISRASKSKDSMYPMITNLLHGTSVNDKRLESHKPFALRSGDIIKMGGKVVSGNT